MTETILVTGGAGFIGSHLVDTLIEEGHRVRVFDNLTPQVHGDGGEPPDYLNKEAQFIHGDVRDREALRQALDGVEVVFHLASAVGVGQSMYQIHRYMDVNTLGTATLLDILANERHSIRKLIVASSMSIYGEGKYICQACGVVYPQSRSDEQLARREWELRCPRCGQEVAPAPTDEDKPLYPASIYAISKKDQEEMCLAVGRAYGIPTVALRYFNVYGPRQALSNPYTGVAAIFSARLLNGQPPVVYEDGLQSRDYVHVSDVVQASLLAVRSAAADYQVFNVGTGRPTTVLDIAELLCQRLGNGLEPQIVNRFRTGDIRHCYADITRIQGSLGYSPQVAFREGVEDLVDWVSRQEALDLFEQARRELEAKGLTR